MVGYAIVADCDINSEVLRCLGNPRFYIWGGYRTFFYKNYPAQLSYFGKNRYSESDKVTEADMK
jgi:hypothetical protein